jgi:hypothetical protein
MSTIQRLLQNCTYVQFFIRSTPIQIANIVQFLFSIITLLSMSYSLYSSYKSPNRPFKIQSSLWITLITALLFYAILCCLTIFLRLFSFWQLAISRNPCWFMWEKYTCLKVKLPITFSILGYSSVSIILLIERVIATIWNRFYSRYSRFLGLGLVILMVNI